MDKVRLQSPGWGVVVALVAALCAVGLVIPSTYLSINTLWLQNNHTYSHGYILLIFIIYALAIDRRWLRVNPSWLAVPAAFGLGVVWLAGEAVQVLMVQQAVMPLLVFTFFVALVGIKHGLKAAVPLLALFLALPVADFLLKPLQDLTTLVVSSWVRMHGITAYIEGYDIHLPYGVLRIADGCAGLNYLLAGVCIGGFYAYLNLQKASYKIAALLLMILLSLVGNWLRVYLLVLIGYYSKMQSSMVEEHGFFGWVIFAVLAFGFFIFGKKLEKRDDPLEQANVPEEQRLFTRKALVMLTASVVAFTLLPLTRYAGAYSEQQNQQVNISLPSAMAEFSTAPQLRPKALGVQYKGADHKEVYAGELSGETAYLIVASYFKQTQGKELIYFANTVGAPPDQHRQLVTPAGNINFAVGEGSRSQIYWYYRVGSERMASEFETKMSQLKQALTNPLASAVILRIECNRLCDDRPVIAPETLSLLLQVEVK